MEHAPKCAEKTRPNAPTGAARPAGSLGANKAIVVDTTAPTGSIVINTGDGRQKPSAAPTDKEAADLFRSCLAYAGRYTIDGNVVTHHVDISWNESWTGTQQIRIAAFKGNRVELSTKPTPDPVSGRISVRTITWEKMSPETSL